MITLRSRGGSASSERGKEAKAALVEQERCLRLLASADLRYHSDEDGSMPAHQSTLREQGQGAVLARTLTRRLYHLSNTTIQV
jgi:hypothetical protein